MSLLREAEKCLANQGSHAALNALITTLHQSGQWLERVRDADARRTRGEYEGCIATNPRFLQS